MTSSCYLRPYCTWVLLLLLNTALSVSKGAAPCAFILPSASYDRRPLPATSSPVAGQSVRGERQILRRTSGICGEVNLRFSRSSQNDDDNFSEEMQSMDAELAREIEEALSLAKDVLAVENVNNNSVEKLEASSPPIPLPPIEDPPASVIPISINSKEINGNMHPLPPETPPSAAAVSFGESLQKAIGDEVDRLKNLLFGLKEDLKETKSRAEEAEEAAELLKKEIEDSRREREATVQDIEKQFA